MAQHRATTASGHYVASRQTAAERVGDAEIAQRPALLKDVKSSQALGEAAGAIGRFEFHAQTDAALLFNKSSSWNKRRVRQRAPEPERFQVSTALDQGGFNATGFRLAIE